MGQGARRSAALEMAKVRAAAAGGAPQVNPVFANHFARHQVARATPLNWPPMGTAQDALAILQATHDLRYLPMRVEQPAYITMPAQGQAFQTPQSSAALTQPAVGSDLVVATYVCPPGRNGVIHYIGNSIAIGGFTDGSGTLSWRLDMNGSTYQGFNGQFFSVSMSAPQDFTASPIRIFENQVVQLILTNNSLVAGPGIVQGFFRGYVYPINLERQEPGF
jgi:hypothetical protein